MLKMTTVVLGARPAGGWLKPKASICVPSTSSSTIFTLNRRQPPPMLRTPFYNSSTCGGRSATCLPYLSSSIYTNTMAAAASSSFSYSHRGDRGGIAAFTSVRNANTDTATPAQQQCEDEEDELSKLRNIKEAANTLDLRVGKILIAYKHPEADSLYVEEVDVGEPQPRIICSGLVNFIPINNLQHLNVVVLANLKPRNMRGVRSFGMLMAASDTEHENVELLMPPENSVPGERIWFGSAHEMETLPDVASPNQIQKKKIWELVQPHLKTDDSGTAALGSHTMRTAGGVVVARSLKNARIS